MLQPFSCIELRYEPSSERYFQRMRSLSGRVWLDTSFKNGNVPQFDILTAEPCKILRNPDASTIETAVSELKNACLLSDDIRALPFCGGAIGYLNYEHCHREFGLTKASNTRNSDSLWGIFDWALVQAHHQKRCWLISTPCCNAEALARRLALFTSEKVKPGTNRFSASTFRTDTSKEEYFDAFRKIQSYINAGDCYQINYSQRFSAGFSGAADVAYCHLRQVLPGPYSAYIHLGDEHILSFSPEQFIDIQGRQARTRPIKGTAPRDISPETDRQRADNLLHSEKNRAENMMIVDLLRNDFSKLSEPRSVKVPTLFALESYANVHHLVSTIEGTLKPGVSPSEFLFTCFPGGSITGAPKQRAMEIIDELEKHPRGIYCGSIAYRSLNDKTNANIAIRTLRVRDDTIHCWGGGGIVADSTANAEYEESIHKVKVLMDAIGRAR